VAIYSAVRLDFDLGAAVTLALVQVGVCLAIILTSAAFAPIPSSLGPVTGRVSWRDHGLTRGMQWVVLIICVIGFVLPLLAVLGGIFTGGVGGLLVRPAFWGATATSFGVAIAAAALNLGLAVSLALARAATARAVPRLALTAPGYTYLAVPGMVLALGFFLVVRGTGLVPEKAGPFVVVIGSALIGLPFAMATLSPPLDAISRTQGRLIRSLGLTGWEQFRLIEWPLLGRDFGVALALTFCFSLGDLGVISLFGTANFKTLPLMMVEALGAYRTNDAALIGALMLIATIATFTLLPPLFERLARAGR
jgi:thiamine transport system permease protein